MAPRSKTRRFLALLSAGLFLVAIAWAYLQLTYGRPVGHGAADPVWTNMALFERPWSSRPVLVVGLGDSVTAGFGARPGYGYFDRVVRPAADDFPEFKTACLSTAFPNLRSTNLAVSGSTSFECLSSQVPAVPRQDEQTLGIVLITTGGNDLIHNYGRTPPRPQAMYGATLQQAQPWIASFKTRLETILETASSRFPGGCQIFLANIYDPTDGVGDIQKAGLSAWPDGTKILEAYNGVLLSCAERRTNVHLVNIHDLFLGHGIHCRQFWSKHYDRKDPHYWYFTNLEDPNERGYDAMRRAFLMEISRNVKQLH